MAVGTLSANLERGSGRIWRFAECEFDELRYELRVKGVVVELESKPREVLHQLLLRPGEVLTKEELLQAVWPGLTVVDSSLATAISKLRKALGEENVIITVPRVGYRLGVPAELREASATNLPSKPKGWWVAAAAAALALAAIGGLVLYKRSSAPQSRPASVAVLPFQNVASDSSIDYLRSALADQITMSLSRMQPLTTRPFASASQFTGDKLDLAAIGRELGADDLVTGRFTQLGDQLQVTMEAVESKDNRLLWRDTFNLPGRDLLGLQSQIALVTRGRLAPSLGAKTLERSDVVPPKNAEAYELYLKSIPVSADPIPNKQAEAMLERSVQVDPTYAPAWNLLSVRYYAESRWGNGGDALLDRADAAAERVLSLDPSFLDAASELAVHRTERGQLLRSYRTAKELIQRRPDIGLYHHTLSYVLRYGGDLEEAGRQCDVATLLDTVVIYGSCSTTFMELGNYQRAMVFTRKDLSSEWSKAHVIEIQLRLGNVQRVLEIGAPKVPQWPSYGMLMACARNAPALEIERMAAALPADVDPEVNYFVAGHLSYCGQTERALEFLRKAIAGGYCSYPAMDSDPLFANLRKSSEFASVREAGLKCHQNFIAQRNEPAN
jgi:DNA-binding winged helix-turn-helix (wHTH) protein/TolB-like protein